MLPVKVLCKQCSSEAEHLLSLAQEVGHSCLCRCPHALCWPNSCTRDWNWAG